MLNPTTGQAPCIAERRRERTAVGGIEGSQEVIPGYRWILEALEHCVQHVTAGCTASRSQHQRIRKRIAHVAQQLVDGRWCHAKFRLEQVSLHLGQDLLAPVHANEFGVGQVQGDGAQVFGEEALASRYSSGTWPGLTSGPGFAALAAAITPVWRPSVAWTSTWPRGARGPEGPS